MTERYLRVGTRVAKHWLIALLMTIPGLGNAQNALHFDGTNDYVTMGAAPGLNVSPAFTIECWLRRTGAGASTTTGTGGVTAVPLVAKGRGEADTPANLNCNYFLGLTAAGLVTADFEATGGGQNYPVTGTVAVAGNVWTHVAVTYGAGTWTVYVNGVLDRSLAVAGAPVPEPGSIQHFALGTALTSTGVAAGFWQGDLDNVRVWSVARTAAEVAASYRVTVAAATPGLVANYRLDEGTGLTTANGGGAGGTGGTLTNGPTWVAGAPNTPPNTLPVLGATAPANNFRNADTTRTRLSAAVFDADGDPLTVEFWGRKKAAARASFTIVPVPDMQFYHGQLNGGTPAIGINQMTWLKNNVAGRNIVFAPGLGDCTQLGDNGGNNIEWTRANASYSLIETGIAGLADGLPYCVSVGNHDQSPNGDARGTTTFFNQYFGAARFAGRGYYGGHYGANNDNSFQLFSGGPGLDFINISLEYDTNQDLRVLAWADSLLKAHPRRRGVVSSHWILNADNSFGPQGQLIYNTLRNNPNLDLLLCGHVTEEARRADTYNGHTTYSLMSDYQARANGGNGWLRIMEFVPNQDLINVKTYSTTLQQFETDANSQFTLAYDQNPNPWQLLQTQTGPLSGTTVTYDWTGLDGGAEYEWYVVLRDAGGAVQSPGSSFGTVAHAALAAQAGASAPPLTVFPNPGDMAQLVVQGLDQLGSPYLDLAVSDLLGRVLARTTLHHVPARYALAGLLHGLPAGQYVLRASGPGDGAPAAVRFELSR